MAGQEFDQNESPTQWRQLLRLRWPVGGAIGMAFAIGQLIETLIVSPQPDMARLLVDVISWGLLGGLAVWLSLTWASRLERRYQDGLERALREQQELNRRLQRSNSQLALLSEVNRRIVESTLLDDILDAALAFPQRLVSSRAAAVVLLDPSGPIETRAEGASAEHLARLREAYGIDIRIAEKRHPFQLTEPLHAPGLAACLVLPLNDGVGLVGWIELYRETATPIPDDELALLDTISSEITEAIVSARRRSREERAIYELERAIADERARIARDIHDGIAQGLAFMRMRIDLWRDWITTDPVRLDRELNDLKGTLREQIRELRRAIFALRPIQFDELGFVGGLRRYVVEFANQHAWKVQVDLRGAPPALSPEIEATCFRIVQEALTNTAKHAGATEVEVRIDQADQGLHVIVRDNGRGFEPGALADLAPDHVGLRQIRERLAGVRGQLTLLSRPGSGTELRVWIPLGRTDVRPGAFNRATANDRAALSGR